MSQMPERLTPAAFIKLLYDLQNQEEAQRVAIAAAGLEEQMQRLRLWQTERLRSTYADLLSQPEYRPACEFFLNDLYAAQDFSQRDQDAERLYQVLSRYLPASMLHLLGDSIYLTHSTNRLDSRLLQALVELQGPGFEISPALYAEGYRRCDNYAERVEQVNLLAQILEEAAMGARRPLFAATLKLARVPAERLGWSELHGFLQRGYLAAKHMRNVAHFVSSIRSREMQILDKIFRSDADPFSI